MLKLYYKINFATEPLLTYNSLRVFGRFGDVIFATTVILACLTTCIGLVNACSAFAKKYIPNMSYKLFVLVFSIVGFLFTTLGLDMILKIAVPLLTFIYPVSIVLVLVSFVNMWFKERFRWTYTLAMIPTLLISILQILNSFKLLSGGLKSFFEMLPFAKLDLAWTIPFLVCAIIGFIIDKLLENKHKKATN
nr:branched-chain amino acid transport system II carrier protein [Staphylococcus massiliensis]